MDLDSDFDPSYATACSVLMTEPLNVRNVRKSYADHVFCVAESDPDQQLEDIFHEYWPFELPLPLEMFRPPPVYSTTGVQTSSLQSSSDSDDALREPSSLENTRRSKQIRRTLRCPSCGFVGRANGFYDRAPNFKPCSPEVQVRELVRSASKGRLGMYRPAPSDNDTLGIMFK